VTVLWDDRKHELSRALTTCAQGDTSAVWAVVEAMQSEIDYLGGRLLDAKEERVITEHVKVKLHLSLFEMAKELGREPEVREDVRWQWDVQFLPDGAEPNRAGVWVTQSFDDAWRRYHEHVSAATAEDRPHVKLVYRVISDPLVYEVKDPGDEE
jgi:hypothetical protein